MIRPSSILFVSSFVALIATNAQAQAVAPSKDTAPPALPAPAAAAPTTTAPVTNAPATMPALPAPAPQVAPTTPPAASPADAATERAETPPPSSPQSAPKYESTLADGEEPSDKSERAHTGFAMALSLGYAAPAGSATGSANDSLSELFTGQVPLTVEIGGNVTPIIFIGVYGSYAFGGVAGESATTCTQYQLDCSAHTLRGGFAFRARFLPEGTIRPWVGYAFGYEQSTVSLSDSRGNSASLDASGWELGKFSVGLDVESQEHNAAIGPFIDVGVGQYGHLHSEGTGAATKDADVDNTALHEWITIGLKATFMP